MAVIEARGIYHIFRDTDVETVALRGADLTAVVGVWTSVMGPSGSGKSTLMQVMAGLLTPSGGQVLIDGEDLTRLPDDQRARKRRQRIGILGQRHNLHPLLDVRGNIMLPLVLDGDKPRAARRRADERLADLGLTDRATHLVRELSGGEAQRAAIAVALALDPVVLLADEPTGELDERTAMQVLDVLGDARDAGAAIVTVTHNHEVAERADVRMVMKDGQVFADD